MSASLLDDLLPLPATEWPFRIRHLSASQITLFQRCPEQWRREKLLGERVRLGAAAVWGSADHFAHEQNWRQKIDSHEDISGDDIAEAFATGMEGAVEEAGGEKEIAWDDNKPGEIKDRGFALARTYHSLVSPTVQPVAVEERFELAIPGAPVPVVGYVDLRTEGAVLERKTVSKREFKPQWRVQGMLYQAAMQPQAVEWHLSVKTKTPAVVTPSEWDMLRLPYHDRAVDAAQVLVRSVARSMLAMYAEFGPNEPWPGALTHPWACGYCGFRPHCSWWGN